MEWARSPHFLPRRGGSARFPLLEVLFVSTFPLVGVFLRRSSETLRRGPRAEALSRPLPSLRKRTS